MALLFKRFSQASKQSNKVFGGGFDIPDVSHLALKRCILQAPVLGYGSPNRSRIRVRRKSFSVASSELILHNLIVGGRIEVDSEYGQGCSKSRRAKLPFCVILTVNAKLAFRFFVKITACPSQKRALEDDDDAPAEEEEHVAKRRDIKPDSKIRVLVVEGKFFLEAHEITPC